VEPRQFTILILEDDPNDVFLLQRALHKNQILNPVRVVGDGVEGVAYLSGTGKYADRETYPFPSFIILDLKMPRMGGLEVLQWLQQHPEYQVIPTLVLTSSKQQIDIVRAYRLGVNSYMVKPGSFDELQAMIRKVYDYWTVCAKPEAGAPSPSLREGLEL
jgi:CheY-like chemotaxis protein